MHYTCKLDKMLSSWGPFLERPGNLSGPISVFGGNVSFENLILRSYNFMKTLAKYHVCNYCVIGEKTFRLPGVSRNGPQNRSV